MGDSTGIGFGRRTEPIDPDTHLAEALFSSRLLNVRYQVMWRIGGGLLRKIVIYVDLVLIPIWGGTAARRPLRIKFWQLDGSRTGGEEGDWD